MLGCLRRFRQRAADTSLDDDPEIQEEREEARARVRAAEAAGATPVLETQHRAIGADICHFAVPASMPDRDVFGKLFITNRRLLFSGGSPIAIGLGRVAAFDVRERDLVVRPGGEPPLRFRCNSFGDAMMAAWILQRLRT